MDVAQTLGDIRSIHSTVEYCESERLRHIDGYIVIYGKQCRITLSARLHDEDKARGFEYLLSCVNNLCAVSQKPSAVFLWSIADERQAQ